MTPLGEFLRKQNATIRAVVPVDLEASPDWPAWVVDTCDAVDKLIDLHAAGVNPCLDVREGGCETLRLLAFPYRDDPEYRDEWHPIDRPRGEGPTADYSDGAS